MQVKGTQVGGGSGSAAKHSSRTPSSSPTRVNIENDYDAAEQARLEAERQKRIKENEEYIANIQATNAEIKDARDKINQAKEILANAVSGDKYKEYSKYLEDQDKWLSQIGNDLNSYGEKAAQNIRENGEAYTFNKTNTVPAQNNNKNNNKALSVNTAELQKLVFLLDDINTSARSIDSKVSGILNDSSKLGIQKSYNAKDNSRNVINSTITLKDRLKQQIRDTEKVEKENAEILEKILDEYREPTRNIKDLTIDKLPSLLAEQKTKLSTSKLNIQLAFMKGVANVGESLLDLGIMGVSGLSNILFGWNMTKEEKDQLRKDTMTFVAEDYVESAYANFYKNNDVGKWLDQKAYKPFKSTGSATNIAAGLGEAAGTVAVATVTGGSSAVVAGAVATGKYTEEYWSKARDNATPGTEWTTKENYKKGIVYGAANGAWEGAQWYVGGKLNALEGTGARAIRVATDTAMNALDTPFRSLVDAYAYDKTFSQAFEDRGGLKATAIDAGIGLAGSLMGEATDAAKKGKADKTTQNMATDKVEFTLNKNESTSFNLDENIQQSKEQMHKYFNNHPELGITDEQLENSYKNIAKFRSNDDFDQFAIQNGFLSEEEVKYTSGYAVNKSSR